LTIGLRGVSLPLTDFVLDVSLELNAASTAIYGASGAGKTSLVEVIAGLRHPIAGQVALGDHILFDAARGVDVPPRARRVGYVPQDETLFPHLSVRQNILYGAANGNGDDRFSLDRAVGALEIEHLLDRGVARLSGGERKRVAMVRALLSQPEILLLDEPLAGIDVALGTRILDYLIRVRHDFPIPILFVTHQMDEAAAVCDEIVVLDRGRVKSQGAIGTHV
jgi:molybdate transport system ATP-binding protein